MPMREFENTFLNIKVFTNLVKCAQYVDYKSFVSEVNLFQKTEKIINQKQRTIQIYLHLQNQTTVYYIKPQFIIQ